MMRSVMVLLLWMVSIGAAVAEDSAPQPKLVKAARDQVGVTIQYDPDYVVLPYPNGDVPKDRGVCSDVVIRALRASSDIDLQKLVHEDMQAHFSLYPKEWGLSKADKNIDHRRVPNLQVWFKRHGESLPVASDPVSFQAGDIVTILLPGNLPHVMVVSDRRNAQRVPLVIHNIGRGAQEEDMLFAYPLTGHFRLDLRSLTPQAVAR